MRRCQPRSEFSHRPRAWLLAVVSLVFASGLPAQPLPGRVLWTFDEAAGPTTAARGAVATEGRLCNVSRGPGHDGGGLVFGGTGADSFLRIPDCEELRFARSFTVQFWWQKTAETVQILFRKGAGSLANYYGYYEGGLRFTVFGADGRAYAAAGPKLANGWHHLAFTCDGAELRVITDGQVVANAALGCERLFRDDSDLLIGTYSPGYRYCLGGVLDELCLSDRAVAPAALAAEVAAARALPSSASQVSPAVLAARGSGLVLARDGRPGATIVIAAKASELQARPARDLQRVLRKATGATLPLRTDADRLSGNLVLVGESALTRKLGLPAEPLTGDAFVLRTLPGRLVLLGNDALMTGEADAFVPGRCKAGTSNAVYAFLHDVCGVRWFLPGTLGEVIPARRDLAVGKLDHREQPARRYVLGSLTGGETGTWGRRNLLGSALFIKHLGGHLWYTLIPEKQYFADHPDWFALLDGKRTGEGNHLCVTNPEMFAEALGNLKAIFAEGYEWVQLGQSDGWRRCRCEACEAQDEYRSDGWWVPGVPADRINLFHAALAEQVRQAYPGRKLLVIAYGPTGEVPRRLPRLPDNVVVEFTHDPPELLARWGRYHQAFSSYVYWFGLYHTLGYAPKSSPAFVAAELRRHRAAGAQGFFFCGGGECWATEAPAYYLTAELLRNPRGEEKALLREFCAGLFGAAGPTMQRYFGALYAGAEEYHRLTKIEVVPGQPYAGKRVSAEELYLQCFTPERLQAGRRLLAQAEGEVRTDEQRLRLRLFRDGFDYVRLTAEVFDAQRRNREAPGAAAEEALAAAQQRRDAQVDLLLRHQQENGPDLPPPFAGGADNLRAMPGSQ